MNFNMCKQYTFKKFPYRTVARTTPKSRTPVSSVQKIQLVPYGCARLRMTEMPVLK